ncbi:hypothetical protein [Actinoallomurus iriomotensis]|uniref:CU044_5270 family protein n=1 Tax=Actinoallomurus iriomotensis TaxID=478107 RepID=A0A9W6VK67_9ACTN|nr:hypothetical protein [Actinoallomurus iriomotensis]GLY74903.1 hypothetical protein Airi01_031700 [Actinoallomurus iriomotensis]
MDEVRMVRDSYPEPAPPTAREIARAKSLLAGPPRRSRPRLLWGLGGVVAAGAATAVALTLVGGNAPAPPQPTGPVHLDDKALVLAAAEKAEQQPTGVYWHTDVVQGQSFIVRAKTGTYAITGALDEMFGWWGAKSGMGEGHYGRDLPARPVTARDAALWRKAGSPSTFRVWAGDHYDTYTTKAQKWQMDGVNKGTDPHGGGSLVGALGMSVEELQKLPSDSAKLAEMFLSDKTIYKKEHPMGAPAGRTRQVPPAVKLHLAGALAQNPVQPKVRAGLMRAATTQPGIHAIGRDTDPLGRPGVALAADDTASTWTGEYGGPQAARGTYRSRKVIVFDQRTGAMLSEQEELTKPGGPYAEMKPGFIIDYVAYRSAGWTDTKPSPSAELPFR